MPERFGLSMKGGRVPGAKVEAFDAEEGCDEEEETSVAVEVDSAEDEVGTVSKPNSSGMKLGSPSAL